MFMHGRKPKVQQQPALHSAYVRQRAPAFTGTDKEAVRVLHRLRNAHSTKDPLGFLTSEGTQLLCRVALRDVRPANHIPVKYQHCVWTHSVF